MDSNNGGQSSAVPQKPVNEQQRQTAAGIARKRVLAAYGHNVADNQTTQQSVAPANAVKPTINTTRPVANVARPNVGTMQNSTNGMARDVAAKAAHKADQEMAKNHLKDQRPVPSKQNSEDWRKYHSAWQNYYQKYYSEYYANAARNYVEKERLKDARKRAEEEDTLSAIGKLSFGSKNTKANAGVVSDQGTESAQNPEEEIDNIGAKLKQTIRKKAVKNVKKSRRRRRWIPVLAGAFVVLFILFMQYNRLIFAPIFAYMSPGDAPATSIEAIDPTVSQTVSADPRLIIPKLNVDVPIHFGLSLSEVMDAMNSGVAHYRIAGASAYPGEMGNTVLTGHSSGDVYSSNPYKYIFSGLERLEDGDLIYVNYESVRYTYQVSGKKVVEPTDVQSLVVESDVPMLTLVTCTPLGTSRYRLLVFADQISPSPENAEAVDEGDTVINVEGDAGLPSSEPTLFENIWNFLTGGNH